MKRSGLALVVGAFLGMLFAVIAVAPASASDWLSGPHYNLNILGGPSCGSVPSGAGGGSRHTIFVPLTTVGDAPGGGEPESTTFDATDTSIFLLPDLDGDFEVCQGDACAAAVDCNGIPLGNGRTVGGVFQLPCDAIAPSGTISTCAADGLPTLPYCVYAEALGKPGGKAQITTCAVDATNTEVCSTTPTPILMRNKGQPKPMDVTFNLTTLTCAAGTAGCPCMQGICTFEIFNDAFQFFLWDYDNAGLKNLQVRFYQNPPGATATSCPVP
jgi:hypothetical protein